MPRLPTQPLAATPRPTHPTGGPILASMLQRPGAPPQQQPPRMPPVVPTMTPRHPVPGIPGPTGPVHRSPAMTSRHPGPGIPGSTGPAHRSPLMNPRPPAPTAMAPLQAVSSASPLPIQTGASPGIPPTHRVVVSTSGDPKGPHGTPQMRKTVTLTASAPNPQLQLHPQQQTPTGTSKENLYIVALPQGHQLRQGQNIVAATIMNRPEAQQQSVANPVGGPTAGGISPLQRSTPTASPSTASTGTSSPGTPSSNSQTDRRNVAEILATRTGMAPNLETGELEARLQHFCHVLEITMQTSNLSDSCGDSWAVARLYDRKVQQKVDTRRVVGRGISSMKNGLANPTVPFQSYQVFAYLFKIVCYK